jgi:hypothetical protein
VPWRILIEIGLKLMILSPDNLHYGVREVIT